MGKFPGAGTFLYLFQMFLFVLSTHPSHFRSWSPSVCRRRLELFFSFHDHDRVCLANCQPKSTTASSLVPSLIFLRLIPLLSFHSSLFSCPHIICIFDILWRVFVYLFIFDFFFHSVSFFFFFFFHHAT